ncbi:MAG TPA: transcription elongation factor GreB [Steroidobacteraceae bacterium]|nr:transcription elongation factor GreB [Steroidobacteraceae bacterium]
MSRYRTPVAPGSQYITPEGAKRLREELHRLWHEERPRVTQAVSEAAAQGDRSENAEYTYGKRRLHEIDRRVRFLRKRLDGMKIIDPLAEAGRRDANRVYFGAWVQTRYLSGETRWYRVVGPDEFDMAEDYLSMDSPLGKSLLGKRRDDEVTVRLPAGPCTLEIVEIRYGPRPSGSAPSSP